MSKHKIGILGTGSYLPEAVLTNQDLEKMVNTNDPNGSWNAAGFTSGASAPRTKMRSPWG